MQSLYFLYATVFSDNVTFADPDEYMLELSN